MTSVSDRPSSEPVLVAARSHRNPFVGLRVWVTGASRGLGRAVAEDLCLAGARVAVTARSADGLATLGPAVAGGGTLCVPGSVSDDVDVTRIVEDIQSRWGGLDAVVHCAGISPVFHLADDLPLAVWREVVDVNLTGTFLVAQAAASVMPAGGSIVTVSSVHARSGGRRLAAYSATKGGVESLSRALALDWAERGIRVNCIAPGYFETDMTGDLRQSDRQRARLLAHIPLGVLGLPEQLVETVRLLIGPGGRYMTGSVLTVDGGWTAT